MENRKFLTAKKITILCASLPILLTIFFVALVSILIVSGNWSGGQYMFFQDNEIAGHVADVEKGKPIEGAIVIAMWQRTTMPGGGSGGYVKIIVVETDNNGAFVIPSWKTFKPWNICSSMVDDILPYITIYKPGYKVHVSNKVGRAGFPDNMAMTKAEKEKAKEKYGITPAKLKRIYTDEEMWNNHEEFRSSADFPSWSYRANQKIEIFNAVERASLMLPEVSKKRILKDIEEDRKFWIEGRHRKKSRVEIP